MSLPPIARLLPLFDEEKKMLSVILKRKLIYRMFMFLSAIVLSTAMVIYFNKYNSSYGDSLGIVNVVFVVIIVLCARLLYTEVLEYGKEMRSPNKKVIHTRIAGIKNGKVMLGNKSFSKEEILLDSSEFDSLQGGEEVMLELSAVSNTLFSVKRVQK